MTRQRRGFTVLEILWTLMLFGLLATVAGSVFMHAMKGIGDQRLRQWRDAAQESLIDHLRADVWSSTGAQMREKELSLQTDAGTVIYQTEAPYVRRIAAGETDMRWETRDRAEFAAAGGLITLKMAGRTQTFVAPVIVHGQGGAQ